MPLTTLVGNVTMPGMLTSSGSPLLRRSRPLPVSPVTTACTWNELVVQAIMTVVTLAEPTVPAPLVTTQVWLGDDGWVGTVTAKALPLASGFAKAKVVAFAGTVRLSPPLSCSTRPVPVRPVMVPHRGNVIVAQVLATDDTSAALP